MFSSLRRRTATLVLASLVAACGGDDGGTGPEPVATVTVSATSTTLNVGETTQLSVTLKDADGNTLNGRTVTWSSSSNSIASVSGTGLVTAAGAGTATITAMSEGKSGSVQVTVQAVAGGVTISAISPATLQAGQTGTITGTGFSASASSNIVTIGGEQAIVTAATPTSLSITVPSGLCLPNGNAAVMVRVGTQASAALQHPVQAGGTALSLPVGQLTLMEDAANLCLRFGSAQGNEAYSFGVQSTASSPGTLTPVNVSANAAGSGGGAAAAYPSLRPPVHVSSQLLRAMMMSPDARRWAAHRKTEAKLRTADRQLLPLARALAAERRGLPGAIASARASSAIPTNVAVGDTVTVRVPDLESVCSSFAEVKTVVRVIGERGVWLDDVGNPSGGLVLADFETLSQRFDEQIYATDVEWFGPPSDMDGNGKVVIVVSKEVNKQGDTPPLGFVTSADLVPRTQCASSDFGEIYYGRSGDPAGEFGPVYPDSTARQDAIQLIAHEFTHIIQFGRRIENPQATTFPTDWELEGQATFAEEVNGHEATGRTSEQNYGYDIAWSGFLGNAIPSSYAYYADAFFDLIIYFGLNFDGNNFFKTVGAPEQCSWLGKSDDGNNGPCVAGREVYGVPWSFLRFLTDHYADAVGGGPAFHRAIINGSGAGFSNIASALGGVSIDRVLAEWSASLWLDDRFTGMEEKLTFPSWNLVDIVDEGLIDPAHLVPRSHIFEGFSEQISVRGGSTAYFTIGGGNRPATYVRFRGANGEQLPAHMQVWVVRTR